MLGLLQRCLVRQGQRSLHSGRPALMAVSSDSGVGTTQNLSESDIHQDIDKRVKKSKVVVFMKGTKEQPQCGFSNAVVQIFRMHGVDDFDTVNVLQNEGIRQGIKTYSKWPTIPQVFLDGEFIGGCDIMIQMHRSGELGETLRKAGIESQISDPPAAKDTTEETTPSTSSTNVKS
ncbi:hypothetical protein RvY_03275 [Ramazzottius varieornatus]|uniref:Glutaredoxin-related protein 5, mitochondrial n=1 Tax=Ramazzottius varieornatus TaxID=947166 RepID=A0A1D1UMJ3_RAMVA|nr:hypothetical protein RvY_03275 [Ramazzottius varieornatus]